MIKKVSKQGMCKGVIQAIYKVNQALLSDVPRPIYMLGHLVHNKYIIEAFEKKGIIVLNGASRLDLLDQVSHGSVIVTAHGVSNKVIEKIHQKGLTLIDATCIDVNKTKKLISSKLSDGYQVIYLGITNHPEAEGVIESFPNITFIDFYKELNNLTFNDLSILVPQTTLSYTSVYNIYLKLNTNNPHLKLANEICNATRSRQEALINELDGVDLCIVVGDKTSNNSKMLVDVAYNVCGVKSILVENVSELNDVDLDKYPSIMITSGSSTPTVLVDEIVDSLLNKSKPYKSNIKLDDYIKLSS